MSSAPRTIRRNTLDTWPSRSNRQPREPSLCSTLAEGVWHKLRAGRRGKSGDSGVRLSKEPCYRYGSMPMHFWRKEYFKTLKDAAAAARAVPEWKAYAEFCEQYERGLRREAFLVLERFISFLEGSPVMARRSFVSWLSHQADGCEGRHMLVPYPLQVRIVEPTLV